MWRSHQPRFHPDLNRGLYCERVGVVLSAPIRSYHVLMSILTIGLIVENFLAAKIFPRLTRLPRLSGPSHQIVWHRNKAQQNASCHVSQSCWSGSMLDKKNSMICWDMLRSTTSCDSRAFTSWYDKMRVDRPTRLCALPRVQPTGCEFLRSHSLYEGRSIISWTVCINRLLQNYCHNEHQKLLKQYDYYYLKTLSKILWRHIGEHVTSRETHQVGNLWNVFLLSFL